MPARSRPAVRRRLRTGLTVSASVAVASALVGLGVAVAAPGGNPPVDLSNVVPSGGLTFAPPTAAPTPPPTPPPGTASAVEQRMLATLNQQRAANGLGPLTWSNQLALSSLVHNRAMAAANTLSHQLPGEADFGARITATGYRWRAAAENIGWNGQATDDGAVAIQWMFYNETPPNDGHRRNILSTATTQVGISVVDDGRGKVWVTEDFAAPA